MKTARGRYKIRINLVSSTHTLQTPYVYSNDVNIDIDSLHSSVPYSRVHVHSHYILLHKYILVNCANASLNSDHVCMCVHTLMYLWWTQIGTRFNWNLSINSISVTTSNNIKMRWVVIIRTSTHHREWISVGNCSIRLLFFITLLPTLNAPSLSLQFAIANCFSYWNTWDPLFYCIAPYDGPQITHHSLHNNTCPTYDNLLHYLSPA